jgi:uncharacterized protein YbjT (DUF2867 family)
MTSLFHGAAKSNRRPLIAVLGATGAQGGGLVRALLADPQRRYAVRALTRRPTGPEATALAALGADICTADLDDRASLVDAFAAADGLFAVTNFWEHGSPERELQQARHIAEAARVARVGHVVWSTLEDTRTAIAAAGSDIPMLPGGWRVPHFDAKGAADRVFVEAGVPTTFLHTSFFWENLVAFGMGPQRNEDSGELELTLPLGDRTLPGIAAADIGACAMALFLRRTWTVGASIGIAGAHLTGAQMAAALGQALGEPVRYRPQRWADYARLPFPGAADLANMFRFKHDHQPAYTALRDVHATRHLHPGLQDFDGWLKRHAQRIPVPEAACPTL